MMRVADNPPMPLPPQPPRFLAIETSTDTLSLALGTGQPGDPVWAHSGPGAAQASATLLPAENESDERLRAARPDLALSTDLIVGFPGESEQDFQDTLQMMRANNFMSSFSFCYSDRPGTRALCDH